MDFLKLVLDKQANGIRFIRQRKMGNGDILNKSCVSLWSIPEKVLTVF